MNDTILTPSAQSALEGLFSPFAVKSLKLKNRFVMAPMTRGFSPGGAPGPDVAAYYARRAAGETGLIITEGVYVDHPSAGDSASVPRLDAGSLEGWRGVVEAVHQAGGAIFPQLWHIGATRQENAPPFPETPTLSPSGQNFRGEPRGRSMTDNDVEEVFAAYSRSAALAQKAGFDGLEIHGAHGYLIDQFLWSRTNQRTDSWGGDLKARSRFAVEAVKAARWAVGPDLPIAFRFSQWKGFAFDAKLFETPAELEEGLAPIVAAGVDILHVSTRRFWEPAFEGSDLTLAGWTKKIFGKPVITVGSVGLSNEFLGGGKKSPAQPADAAQLAALFAKGEFDLAAVGRALLADPQWVEKLREGREADWLGYDPESEKTLF